MNHRMTVRTNRNQIFNWVYFVFLTNLSNRDNVVNVNETFAKVAINTHKIKFTNRANMTVVSNASCASFWVAFVSVYCDRHSRAFRIFFWRRNFFGQCNRTNLVIV